MFWRVGIARNAVFCRSFVASKARKGRSEKRGGAEDRVPKMPAKFAPRLRARAIWKSKSLKTDRFGALLEVDLDKICTTPARASGLEVKIVKNWRCRSTFGSCASQKFAPRLRARAIWKSKSLKTGRPGALLEVELRKICTTPVRESDLEVKIVKNWQVRGTFGSWSRQNLHHACARQRFGSQNR